MRPASISAGHCQAPYGRRLVVVQFHGDHSRREPGSAPRSAGRRLGGLGDARDRAATSPIVTMSPIGSGKGQSADLPVWVSRSGTLDQASRAGATDIDGE